MKFGKLISIHFNIKNNKSLTSSNSEIDSDPSKVNSPLALFSIYPFYHFLHNVIIKSSDSSGSNMTRQTLNVATSVLHPKTK